MCGIVGFTGSRNDECLEEMMQSILHRGPDGSGIYNDELIHMGMRRLAVVDLSRGDQPVFNETRTLAVMQNGEIYNHRELRCSLESLGHKFHSDHSDTEVIPHLYEQYGEDWVQHVNGMFAIAIWDTKTKTLLLYRDRIGKKPLYYSFRNGVLVYGSEIKALLKHPRVSRELDSQAVRHYFALKHVPAPGTVYQDVHQLLPGECLSFSKGAITLKRYWSPDFSKVRPETTGAEAKGVIFSILENAVKLRMDCDAPYGAYLSGGVDSSAIVSLMTRFATNPVRTFCLGYDHGGDPYFTGKDRDIEFARLMAKRLGTDHHERILTPNDFAAEMPGVLASFDEPFSGTVSTFFLSSLIRQHVTVAVSGDGADELYGSYLTHRLAYPIHAFLGLRAAGRDTFSSLTAEERKPLCPFDDESGFKRLAALADPDILKWRTRLSVFASDEMSEFFTPEITSIPEEPDWYGTLLGPLTAKDPLNRALEVDQKDLLPNQVLPFVDRLSMAHSVEVRSPYLDFRLIEYVNGLPGTLKIRNGVNKYIHRQTLSGILPQELLDRPKEGFVQPVYRWMHTCLKPWTAGWLQRLPARFVPPQGIRKALSLLDSGNSDANARLWNLVCFSIWWNDVRS